MRESRIFIQNSQRTDGKEEDVQFHRVTEDKAVVALQDTLKSMSQQVTVILKN